MEILVNGDNEVLPVITDEMVDLVLKEPSDPLDSQENSAKKRRLLALWVNVDLRVKPASKAAADAKVKPAQTVFQAAPAETVTPATPVKWVLLDQMALMEIQDLLVLPVLDEPHLNATTSALTVTKVSPVSKAASVTTVTPVKTEKLDPKETPDAEVTPALVVNVVPLVSPEKKDQSVPQDTPVLDPLDFQENQDLWVNEDQQVMMVSKENKERCPVIPNTHKVLLV